MIEQKQPQAGEWWQKDDTRVCIVGTKKNGLTVGEMQSGTLIPFLPVHGWQHLPYCDSFEWQPVEFCVMCGVNPVIPGTAGCKDCTEFALDAVRVPVESPDDWVTQDRVPPRHGIDQVQWSDWGSSRWIDAASGWQPTEIHGYRDEDDDTVLHVRCRRKELPPLPSPKRVSVRLIGRRSGDVRWQELDELCDAHDREIKHDGYKFYVEVQP